MGGHRIGDGLQGRLARRQSKLAKPRLLLVASARISQSMKAQAKCPVCGTEMIQKSQARLVTVGIASIATLGLAVVVPALWAPCIIAALTGTYLLVWATAGKARWCRQCKTFRIK